jgi:hypothetical protein
MRNSIPAFAEDVNTSPARRAMTKGNWVKVSRCVHTHEALAYSKDEPACKRSAWLDLVILATSHGATVRGVKLKRGQYLTTVRALAVMWCWTPAKVRWFLADFTAKGMLNCSTLSSKAGTVVTICNYDKWQGELQVVQQTQQHTDPEITAKREQEGKVKKEKKRKTTSSSSAASSAGSDQAVLPCVMDADQKNALDKTPDGPPRQDPAMAFFHQYNQLADTLGWSRAAVLNAKRRSQILARAKDGDFTKALEAVKASDFLALRKPGRDGRYFASTNIDFLLQPTSYVRLIEGFYGRTSRPNTSASPTPGPGTVAEYQELRRLDEERRHRLAFGGKRRVDDTGSTRG